MSEVEFLVKSLEEENSQLKEKVERYETKLFNLDIIVDELNLTGLNKKQIKYIKKYFQERGKH